MYIQIYIYIYIYVHTPAVAHDMHKAHTVTLWVEEHLGRMNLNGRIFAMQPLFAMPASKKIAVRNRDFLSPRSISES